MGSPKAPEYQRVKFSDLEGGSELQGNIREMMKGLPPALRSYYEKSLGARLKSSKESLNEVLASQGASLSSYMSAESDLTGQYNTATAGIAEADLGARQTGVNQYLSALGLLGQETGNLNQYNMSKYQTDQANSFSWGDFVGDLVGGGATVASGGIARKK